MKFILVILISFALALSTSYGQIPNDNCDDASMIEVRHENEAITINGNMLFSSPSYYNNVICSFPWYHDLWYKFVAPAEEVHLNRSGFVTIHVYENTCDNLISENCSDLSLPTIPGETYFIRLLSPETDLGSFTLTAYYLDDPIYAAEDSCMNAMEIDLGIDSVEGDTISVLGSELSASAVEYCGSYSNKDAWYLFTAPNSGSIDFEVLTGSLSYFSVLENDCNTPIEQTCFASTNYPYVFNLTPGQDYLLKVNVNGELELKFTVKEGPTGIDNWFCDNSEPLDFNTDMDDTISVDLKLAQKVEESNCHSAGNYERSAWYSFIAPSSGSVSLESTNGNRFRYSISEGSCGSLSPIACNRVISNTVLYQNNLISGNNYYLRIEHELSGQDIVNIVVTEVDEVSNNQCDQAQEITVLNEASCSTLYDIDINGATHSSQISPCFDEVSRSDVWYFFEAPLSGSVEFLDGFSTAEKTIYSGNCGSLSAITCIDGKYLRGLDPGIIYYLQVTRNPGSIVTTGCVVEISNTSQANEICDNGIVLTDGMTTILNTAQSSIENGNDPSCDLNPHDLWCSFETPTSGFSSIRFTDLGSINYALYSGDCSSLAEIECKEVSGRGTILFTDLTPSTTYYLQLFDPFNEEDSDINLIYETVAEIEENDECQGAITIDNISTSCTDVDLDFRYSTLSDVEFSLTSFSNATDTFDVWYHFNTGDYTGIQLENESFGQYEIDDLYGIIYNYDCEDLQENQSPFVIGYAESILGLEANMDYYLRLLSKESLRGEFCISYIEENSENSCIDAIELPVSQEVCVYQQFISLSGATYSSVPSSCNTTNGQDVWRYFTMPDNGTLNFISTQSGNGNLTIYSGSCGDLMEVTCHEIVRYQVLKVDNLIAGELYYIGISDASSVDLCAYISPEIPQESQCANAINLDISIDDNCTNSIPGNTEFANESNGVFCGRNKASANFYSIQPTSDGYYTLEISNSAVSHKVAVYQDCILNPPLSCGDNEISYTLLSGSTYIVAVFASIEGEGSSYDICAYPSPSDELESVGISVSNPQVKLDVNGGIKPAYSDKTIAGNIRWSGELEVYDGQDWENLVGWDHQAQTNINMNSKRINNLLSPSQDFDAATKKYVDDHTDNDSNPTNEIQILTKQGNEIELSNGGGTIIDENTTYSGTDFALSNQNCPNGQVIESINSDGTITCKIDDVDDADNDPTNEIETWNTLGGIPSGFADDVDNVDDADNDPTNEIETWNTLAGIPSGFADNVDDVDDADNDPTNEIENWNTLAGIPSGFSDDVDDVDDADNDPTNEIETWSTLAGIPSGFADDVDDVDDADNDLTNEVITEISRSGNNLIVEEAGIEHTISLDTFSSAFVRSGSSIMNIDDTNDDFLFGISNVPISGNTTESFILFDESRAAFRVGQLSDSDVWNTSNLGNYSFATGYNNKASGYYSSAFSRDTKAEAAYSIAIGRFNEGGGSFFSWDPIDPVFEVGIGTLSAPKNALTILKNGRIGIGDSTPDALLQLSGDGTGTLPQLNLTETESSDGARINFTNTSSSNNWTLYGYANNSSANSVFNLWHTTTGNVISAKGNGDFGIGGDPDIDLHLYHGNNGGADGLKLQNTNNDKWIRMYVSSSSGDLRFFSENQGSTIIGAINDDTGVYTALSDRRLKKDFKDLHFDWNSFMKLKTLTYKFKSDDEAKLSIGMVAQDVQKIYPELVTYHEEEDIFHMNYSGIGVVAVKAVQELKRENELLRKENEEMKLRLDRIEKMLLKLDDNK